MAIHTEYSARTNSAYAASARIRALLSASDRKACSLRAPALLPTSPSPGSLWPTTTAHPAPGGTPPDRSRAADLLIAPPRPAPRQPGVRDYHRRGDQVV